jgi:allophanate hydrolase subunit 1
MTVAVDDAIERLIQGYRDVLVTYSLPQIYAEALKKKLEEREL